MTDSAESLEMQRFLAQRELDQAELDAKLVTISVLREVVERVKRDLNGGWRVMIPSIALDRVLSLVEVEAMRNDTKR